MSETKWTPGPWRVHSKSPHLVVDDQAYEVATTHTGFGCPRPRAGVRIANAALIAAAPDLYATLEYLTDLLVDLAPMGKYTERPFCLVNARAVLAKARGETND